jgi:diguanylate cyclase (GGDEF)-like protein/PAS domain S-box-containing protein
LEPGEWLGAGAKGYMTWQFVYLVVIFGAMALSLGIAIYAWGHRQKSAAMWFAGMMLAVAEWLFTSGMVSLSKTPAQARAWVAPRYFGLTVMLAFFFVFVIQYTGHGKWLSRRLLAIVLVIPIVTQVIIETNSFHHLFLVKVIFSQDGMLMGLDSVRYGALFWVHTVYSYLIVLIGTGLIVNMAIHTFHLYREQATFMVIGILPPLLTSVSDAFLLIPGLKHPLAPLGFAFMGASLAWAMFRHQMLDIVPVARDAVIESMSDGLIVLDAREMVVDINPSAGFFLQLDPALVIGLPVASVFRKWDDLVHQNGGQNTSQSVVDLMVSGEERYFDVRISPLHGRRGQSNGLIVMLRDITERKQAENQLQNSLSMVVELQEQLYEQAIRDPLTGLYNRRFFTETIPREMGRATREAYPISFLLMDLDQFKFINDTLGHEAGDVVLKHVATILAKQTRTSDYVFRYGGDEFLVILLGTLPEYAYRFAERLRQNVEDSKVQYAGDEIAITMSIGVAGYLAGKGTPEEIVAEADSAMYRAKGNGRNCVMLFHHEELNKKDDE